MSIKKSLNISIIFAAMIPLVFMTILTYMTSYNKYVQLAKDSASDLAKTYANGFESQLNIQITEVEGLANATSIQNIVLENYNGVPMGTESTYYDSVIQLLTSSADYSNNTVKYYLYDVNGYFIASSSSDEHSDWEEYMSIPVSNITDTSIMKSSNINKNTESIEVITPVRVKNTIVGLIRVNISSEYFGAFIPGSGNAFILTNSDDYLFSANGLEFNKTLENSAKEKIKSQSENGYLSIKDKSFDNIYGYKYIGKYSWLYIIKQDTSQYQKIISTLPKTLFIALLVLLIIAITISRILSNKYTKPIIVLKDNMKEAAAGNLNLTCEITSKDEFGELSDSFNNMMDIISSNYNQLDDSKKALEANEIELKKNYAHIEQLAYHDGLTGLYNRVAFMKYAYETFHQHGSKLSRHAIFFLDLDNFKNVNDTLGHDYGDMLLKQVAAKLTDTVASDDILARTGGDEFLILKNTFNTLDDLESFAKTLVDIIKEPFILDEETANISLSLGIALFPKDGLTISELIKNADIAMYNAKNSGKNSYRFFSSYMEDDFNRKNNLAEILMSVIEKNEIYLNYQPQINFKTGYITGFEALMRINSQYIGNISPAEFIPIAEDSGIIDKLGDWALYEACTFNQSLIDAGFKPITVSVNVSTAQLKNDHLIEVISSIPKRTGMDLKYLELEITESVLMNSLEHNLRLINKFKSMGISIALDDFGTGYSSFNYLTQIPIDTLKIDKSFVDGLCDNEKDRFISNSIISLSHSMDISVVGEGVEDIDQFKILENQECDTLQGYFFSKPLSSDAFLKLLEENQKNPKKFY